MKKIVYLLGAGASATRIPIVKEMGEKVAEVRDDFLKSIHNFVMSSQITFPDDYDNLRNKLYDDFNFLVAGCENYSSVDTFAKKLFLTKSDELTRLKIILSVYFTYLQIKDLPDLRYDNFWAAILEDIDNLPKHIRVASWNYDFQLEQSFINMSGCKDLLEASKILNSVNTKTLGSFDSQAFSLLKLNGSARFTQTKEDQELYLSEVKNGSDFRKNLSQLLEAYRVIKKSGNYVPSMSFAWETSLDFSSGNSNKRFFSNAHVLAVIGYSFPVFNRKIDKSILSSVNHDCHIYIQDRNPESIKERIEQIYQGRFRFTLVNDVSQFVFPIEL